MSKFNRDLRCARRDAYNKINNYCRYINNSDFALIRSSSMAVGTGIAEKEDFGDSAEIINAMLCYKPNQYYVARDPDRPDNLIFASKKQYLRSKAISIREKVSMPVAVKKIVKTNASPVRLFKQAIEYNPFAKSLKFFTSLANERAFIRYIDLLMSKGGDIQLKEASIQDCYDMQIPCSSQGSAERYAVSSCMYRYKVGKFYDNFNVVGYMAYRNNSPIGRFLVWTMDNGKKYVDRLYCPGEYANMVLDKIDEVFKDAEKYPNLPSSAISCKSLDKLDFKAITYPYIDTFNNWIIDTTDLSEMKLMASRQASECKSRSNNYGNLVFQSLRSTSEKKYTPIVRCPKCGKLLTAGQNKDTLHSILCDHGLKGKRLEKIKRISEIINKFNKGMKEASYVKQIIQNI